MIFKTMTTHTSRLSRVVPRAALLLALTSIVGACAEEDTKAPPSPTFDMQESPTGESTVLLTGAAEYGSLITIDRTPKFTDAETTEFGPFVTHADPFTAHWWFVAPLAAGEDNVFTATATDRAGNRSTTGTVTVAQVPPTWVEVQVSVEPTRVQAGEIAVVTVTGVDNYGHVREIRDAELASSDAEVAFDGRKVTHTLAGIKVLTATADGVSGEAELTVDPGPAANVDLTLDAADVDGQTDGLQVLPYSDLGLSWTVTDAYGNAVDAGVGIATNAPGFVRDNTLTRVATAGAYDVVATVLGTGVSDAEAFEVIPGDAATIEIALSSSEVVAGETIGFVATVYDVWGNVASTETVSLTTDAPANGVTLDAATGTVTFTAAGTFGLTATAMSDPNVSLTATIHVRPGPVTVVDLVLDPSPAVVAPNTPVGYTTTATDQYGNLSDETIRLLTNAPGAVIANGQIHNLSLAGTFSVWAEATGSGVSDAETLTVTPGSAAALDLVLIRPTQPTELPMRYFVTIVDEWGNPISDGATITSSDAAAVVDPVEGTITFGTTGVQTVTATYGDLTDTEAVVIYLEPDVGPPTVEVIEPGPNDIYAPGDTVFIRVHATDDRSLSQVQLQIRGAFRYDDFELVPSGITNYTAVFEVRIPNGTDYGTAFMTVGAYDEAGNVMIGTRTSFQVNPTGRIVVPGGTATFIAGGSNSRLSSPRGIDHDGNGLVFVANSGRQNVVTVNLATGEINQFGTGTGQGPMDVATRPNGGVFVTVNNRVVRMNADGGASDPWSANNNGQLHGVVYDPADDRIYVADNNNDELRRYNALSNPTVSPDWTTNVNGSLNGPTGVAVRHANNNDELVYIANDNNDRIIEYNRTQGSSRTLAQGNSIDVPQALILLPNGDLLVANEGSDTLVQVALSTCNQTPCATNVVASGFSRPAGLSLDPSSTPGRATVVVSDRDWNALVEVTFTP